VKKIKWDLERGIHTRNKRSQRSRVRELQRANFSETEKEREREREREVQRMDTFAQVMKKF
jgi:hypothetical protein